MNLNSTSLHPAILHAGKCLILGVLCKTASSSLHLQRSSLSISLNNFTESVEGHLNTASQLDDSCDPRKDHLKSEDG